MEQAPGSRLEARRVAMARARQRRRRAAVISLLVVAIALVGAALARAAGGTADPPPAATEPSAAATGGPSTAPSAPAVTWPEEGTGEWRYAAGQEIVRGDEGEVLRYRVAVEEDLDLDPAEFADAVDGILADPRGWTGSGYRFQRVGGDDESDLTVFLATPGTSEEICAEAGLHTDRFASCRVPGELMINVARWMTGVPDYGAPLAEYRAFALNHELGHELGADHRACPGAGEPAPVMQPQTVGLDGCTPYGWPFRDGERYHGPKVP